MLSKNKVRTVVKSNVVPENVDQPHVCGIVMPISSLDGCEEGHWSEVLSIVTEAVESVGFSANLVSNADDVGIIQKRIIQNLYENPIVVCDVSGKNPNVMFELGMRLAFDKPTIIIKDDKTSYSFDTSPIEHIQYPRDLRFTKIVDFKKTLAEKIRATFIASQTNDQYTTFLKNFGEFKVAKIDEKEVSQFELLSEEMSDLKISINRLLRNQSRSSKEDYFYRNSKSSAWTDICLEDLNEKDASVFMDRAIHHPAVANARIEKVGDHKHAIFDKKSNYPQTIEEIRSELLKELKAATGRTPSH